MASYGAAFAAHSGWISGLRTSYDAARGNSFGDDLPTSVRISQAANAPGPYGGMMVPDDLEFDEPVYRSVGALTLDSDDFEPPVYRSMGVTATGDAPVSPAVPEADWLAFQPPLVRRQRGFQA